MSLPVNHIILASGSLVWEAPSEVEYTICSVLHDAEKQTIRIILEGTDRLGDEIRTTLDWSSAQSMWIAQDYERRHAMLMPFGWTLDAEIETELGGQTDEEDAA